MSPRTIVIIQARMTSTRLPGKVMLPLAGAPLVQRVIERAKRIPGTDGVCLAIPPGEEHAPLRDLAKAQGAALVVGPEDDVLARYVAAAEATGAGIVMRVTSDCPLIDPAVSGAVLSLMQTSNVAYARTAIDSGYPLGLDTEVVEAGLLRTALRESSDPFEREHVTAFIWRRPERFPFVMLDRRPDRRPWRLTVDTAPDYELATAIYGTLHPRKPDFGFADVERLLTEQPRLLDLNAAVGHTAYVGWQGRHRVDA